MPGRFQRRKQKEGKKKNPAFQEKVDYYLQRLAALNDQPSILPELIMEMLPELKVDPALAEAFLMQALTQKNEAIALFLDRLEGPSGGIGPAA